MQTSASKHLEPMLESVRGPAGQKAEPVPAQLWEHTPGSGRSTQVAGAGHTALHRGSAPAALPFPHTGAAQPLWAGTGQMLVPSPLLSPQLLPFPLPGGPTNAFAMFAPDLWGRLGLFAQRARVAISWQSGPVTPAWQSTKLLKAPSIHLSPLSPSPSQGEMEMHGIPQAMHSRRSECLPQVESRGTTNTDTS